MQARLAWPGLAWPEMHALSVTAGERRKVMCAVVKLGYGLCGERGGERKGPSRVVEARKRLLADALSCCPGGCYAASSRPAVIFFRRTWFSRQPGGFEALTLPQAENPDTTMYVM